MCNSQAEGGQRCYGHAKTALIAAEAKYDVLVEEAGTYTRTGRAVPTELRDKGIQAGYDRQDALTRYTSTPQGAADLATRMDAMTVNGKAPVYQPGNHTNETYHDYAEALSDGARIRARAKDIHDAVKNGTMTGEEATADAQAQADRSAQWRRYGSLMEGSDRVSAGPTPPPAPTMESSRTALKAATDATIASTAKEVKAAVNLIAATVRNKYPNAKRVELEGSDQGDFLNVISIDGDDNKVYDLEAGDDSDADNLSWASSCIYDAHRSTAPALHSANNQIIQRTDSLYIDIAEALDA